jgi:amidase
MCSIAICGGAATRRSRASPKARLEGLSARTERLTKKSDGSSVTRRVPINNLDGNGWNVSRMTLQMLVDRVMAEHKLDALFYPTKTIPAPRVGMPVEPANIKIVKETVAVTIDGEPHERTVDRAIDARAPLTWRLSPNGGFPTVVVPAGFTKEVYDRAVVRGADGSRRVGELVGPTAVELPVSVDFLGRAFSEPLLIRIAAAYEQATRHRKPPKAFTPSQPPAP